MTFYITFKYDDIEVVSNNILNSYIRFLFKKLDVLANGMNFNMTLKNIPYDDSIDTTYYETDDNRIEDYTVKRIIFGTNDDYFRFVDNVNSELLGYDEDDNEINLYRILNSDDTTYTIYILSDTGKFVLGENAAWLFDKLYVLEEIIGLTYLDTSNVVNMRDVFCDCPMLKNVDLSNWDTSNVTNMTGMFARMTSITFLDLTTFDTSNVKLFNQMFTTNTSLKAIYVSDFSTENMENDSNMFASCTKLVGQNGTAYNSSYVNSTYAKLDGSTKGYLSSMYKLDTGINVNHAIKAKTEEEIADWTTTVRFEDTEVTNIIFGRNCDYEYFLSSYEYVAVDEDESEAIRLYRKITDDTCTVYIISNVGTFKANEDSSWLFDKLHCLISIENLNLLDTSEVVNMRDMFCDDEYLVELNLSNFNTKKVTNMTGMFARMYTIEILDLSSFEKDSLNTITSMFSHAKAETYTHIENPVSKLKTIYVSEKFDLSTLATVSIFSANVNLVGGNGTTFDSTKFTNTYGKIDGGSDSPGYFTRK